MTAAHSLYIDGVAFWSPTLPDWPAARAALCREAGGPAIAPLAPLDTPTPPARRPAPKLLAANERRRAPDSVLLALEVASAATADAGHDAGALASVFTSAHGDLPIIDALCTTLAADPLLLSPTRFHHSVHNAASGYWAIASGSQAASTALAAYEHSFAAGLLEAATACAADGQPLLLVAGDTAAVGGLASTNRSRGLLALALVLSPRPGPRSRWLLDWRVQAGRAAAPPPRSAAARVLADNAMADALPFAEALAAGSAARLALPLGPALHLALVLQPHAPPPRRPAAT